MCVADVITTRPMLLPMIFCILADVIAIIVADVTTTVLNVLADGIAKWQMEWPTVGWRMGVADVIATGQML